MCALNFRKCKLDKANLKGLFISNTGFRGAVLYKTVFSNCSLRDVDFTGATGKLIAYQHCSDRVKFEHIKLPNSILDGSEIRNSDFHKASFAESSLNGVRIISCILKESHFSKISAKKTNIRDIEVNNTSFVRTDLNSSKIENSNFTDCLMMGLYAQKIKTNHCTFYNCDLSGANFENADLVDTEFKNCKLSSAVFTNTDLSKYKITECDIATTKFS